MSFALLVLVVAPAFSSSSLPSASFQTLIRYEKPDNELSITKPFSIHLDKNGKLYVLDVSEKTVFMWDEKGKYIKNLGRPGLGPGEINVEDGWGCVTTSDDRIIVLDTRIRKVHFWGNNLDYIESKSYSGLGRVGEIEPYGDGYLVVTTSHKRGDTRLLLVDSNFTIEEELANVQGSSFSKNEAKGWDYKPFAPTMVTTIGKDDIWYAKSTENWIRKINSKGDNLKEYRFPLVPKPLPNDDILFYRREFKRWAGDKDRFIVPEVKPLIDILMSLDNGLILASQYSMEGGLCEGYVIDKATGKAKAKFTQFLGYDLGFMIASHGKLLTLIADQDGDYQASLVKIIIPEVKDNESKDED